MSLRCSTPCDFGECPYNVEYNQDCESAQVRAGLSSRPPVKGFAFTLGANWSLLLNCNLDKSAFLRYNIIVRGGEGTASEREPLLES